MFSNIDSSSGFTEIKKRKREKLLKGEEGKENLRTYLSLFSFPWAAYTVLLRGYFSHFTLLLVLLMSRDWKHFLVKRFVHVMPWAISSPHDLKCPHYNDFNPLPAGLRHVVQSKLFFPHFGGSNNRNKEVHSRPKEGEEILASRISPSGGFFLNRCSYSQETNLILLNSFSFP
jgi:hypothetical protein